MFGYLVCFGSSYGLFGFLVDHADVLANLLVQCATLVLHLDVLFPLGVQGDCLVGYFVVWVFNCACLVVSEGSSLFHCSFLVLCVAVLDFESILTLCWYYFWLCVLWLRFLRPFFAYCFIACFLKHVFTRLPS